MCVFLFSLFSYGNFINFCFIILVIWIHLLVIIKTVLHIVYKFPEKKNWWLVVKEICFLFAFFSHSSAAFYNKKNLPIIIIKNYLKCESVINIIVSKSCLKFREKVRIFGSKNMNRTRAKTFRNILHSRIFIEIVSDFSFKKRKKNYLLRTFINPCTLCKSGFPRCSQKIVSEYRRLVTFSIEKSSSEDAK